MRQRIFPQRSGPTNFHGAANISVASLHRCFDERVDYKIVQFTLSLFLSAIQFILGAFSPTNSYKFICEVHLPACLQYGADDRPEPKVKYEQVWGGGESPIL